MAVDSLTRINTCTNVLRAVEEWTWTINKVRLTSVLCASWRAHTHNMNDTRHVSWWADVMCHALRGGKHGRDTWETLYHAQLV